MANDGGNNVSGVVGALLSVANKETKEMVNHVLQLVLIFAMAFVPMAIMLWALYTPKPHCWRLQAVNGTTYKVNACTGKVILLEKAIPRHNGTN